MGPHGLDAWRIDVANMTGIHGPINLSHQVATTIRNTMTQVNPAHFLQAESNHDASRDLLGDGYQGTMNYAAFTRPLWQWLIPPQHRPYPHTKYPAIPNLPGDLVVAAMRELSGVTPWMGTLHAMNLIGSHDTHRVASLLGDPAVVDVAFGLLASYPGVPMIYAGDEIGLATLGPEHARIPMPWHHPDQWDTHRLTHTRALFTHPRHLPRPPHRRPALAVHRPRRPHLPPRSPRRDRARPRRPRPPPGSSTPNVRRGTRADRSRRRDRPPPRPRRLDHPPHPRPHLQHVALLSRGATDAGPG